MQPFSLPMLAEMSALGLRLRPVTELDASWTWTWANDPAVRAASFSSSTISLGEHNAWIRSTLANPERAIYVVSDEAGSPMALVRFDGAHGSSDGRVEVSLTVGPEFRGRGIGTRALGMACDEYQKESRSTLAAYVKASNAASVRVFEKAGFVARGVELVRGSEALAFERCPQVPVSGAFVFRVDAGADAGLGHLHRCLALADSLRRRGHQSHFVLPADDHAERAVADAGFGFDGLPHSSADHDADAGQVEAAAGKLTATAAIVDSYQVGADYLSRLRAAGLFVVAIDDLAREPFSCQLVVNGGAQAGHLPYRSASGDTRFLLGPQYALLRSAFRDVPVRPIETTVSRVMLTGGGADAKDITPRLIELLSRSIDDGVSIDVVIGPLFRNREAIERTAARCTRPVRLLHGLECLRDVMLEADLAISAGGQTLYELAATGTPTIALALYDNQIASTAALVDAGTIAFGGLATTDELQDELPGLLASLLHDRDERQRMSAAGRRLVDGCGADRVATAIEEWR